MAQTDAGAPERSALSDEQLRELFESRASMYGLLAAVFRHELDADQISEIKRMRFPRGTGNAMLDQGFQDMYDYLRNAWDGCVTELAVDYARTFIGSGVSGYSAAYLYESVYTSQRRLLGREARGEVLQFFRNNNLVKGKWNDMEDHLAIELEFMQVMSLRAAQAVQRGDEEGALNNVRCQHDFVRDHLNNWLPMMVGDALKFAQTKFYQGVCRVVLGYCEDEEKLLAELVQDAPETVDVKVA